ncbi:MAG TPA: branched-chain amino acid ABC transporter permease, partial [Acidimicrobiales bacterium]|nr:branched-chain amino acid ABC transporter permease [Acidimicrobiales bacterium]
ALGRAQRRLAAVPASARAAAFVAALALLPVVVSSGYIIEVGVSALLMALLAMGLNLVAGWGGLLDLGYVAFYGFGAYLYALLSSPQINVELPGLLVMLIVLVASAALGCLVGLPSIRLAGDYLAIVTLFFGEAFVQVVNNVAPNVLGGPDGIPGANTIDLAGWHVVSVDDDYVLLLVLGSVVGAVLFNLNRSRLGRGWRALREDGLAAEVMGVPVNRMKLLAFTIGAAVAGLTGTVFASVEYGAYPTSFNSQFLVMIYAAVVLGGTGSLTGVILGAGVVIVLPEVLRSPGAADILFYLLTVVGIVAWIRPLRRMLVILSATLVIGFAARAVVAALRPHALAGSAFFGPVGRAFVISFADPSGPGDVSFIALVVAFVAVVQLHGRRRDLLLPVVLYLAVFAWQNLLVQQPQVTRELFLGVLLVAAMNLRPQGLLGQTRVEVV